VNYFRYVDEILLIYYSLHTDIHAILHEFNFIHPHLQFTQETEQNNAINHLDITIHKTLTNIKISIHKKPTFTDSIIPYISSHPTQQKHAAVRFLYNRLKTYQIFTADYQREENNIYNILRNSDFPTLPQRFHHPPPPSTTAGRPSS